MSDSAPGSPKRPQWQELYEAAVLELDRAVLPNRIQAARAAIEARIVELRTSATLCSVSDKPRQPA